MTTPTDVAVRDAPDAKRFEGHVDGEIVGVIDYIPLPGKIIATHTEVFGDQEGRGIGSALVRGMIDILRNDGRRLQPLCPYVTAFLQRHPEYGDVVDQSTPH